MAKFGAEEIIVVDDGCTDGTLAGARQFESNEVRVVTQPNHRAAAGRVPSARDTANPDELKDDLEKYEHLQELPSDSSRQNAATLGTTPRSPEYPPFWTACYRD